MAGRLHSWLQPGLGFKVLVGVIDEGGRSQRMMISQNSFGPLAVKLDHMRTRLNCKYHG